MTTLDLFDGPSYEPEHDQGRLMRQHERIRDFMLGHGGWWSLAEIAESTSSPAASVSAQLRHLRKARFGGYIVQKRHRGNPKDGCWEYHVSEPIIGEAVA